MWKSIFETTRLPVVPIYGLFPVKLKTHIGRPIYPSPGTTPEQLANITKQAMEDLIAEHQTLPSTLAQVGESYYMSVTDYFKLQALAGRFEHLHKQTGQKEVRLKTCISEDAVISVQHQEEETPKDKQDMEIGFKALLKQDKQESESKRSSRYFA